jgi:cell division transport system permease protein
MTRAIRSKKPRRLYLANHSKALSDSWSQLRSTPMATLVTCTIMAIATVLTSLLFLGLGTFQRITEGIHANNEVAIYLKSASSEQQIQTWADTLRKNPLIRDVSYISPDQALKELTQEPGYGGILNSVTDNPLPPVILIKFQDSDKAQITAIINQLRAAPLVEAVHLNFEWFERLFALLKLAHRITYVLAALLSFGIIFIVSHAIQGATQKNQQEMTLLQLIGAKPPFLRRPFLYLGSLLGVGAGIITLLLLTLLFLAVQQPIADLLTSYRLSMTTPALNFGVGFAILFCSTLLGWLGARIAFYRYAHSVALM